MPPPMEDIDSDGQSPDTMPGADDAFEDIPIPEIPSFASDDDRHSNIGQDEDSSSDDGESFQIPASSSPTFMTGASELTKKLLYGQITDPREGSTIGGPAEERHPWWFGWQPGMPEILLRGTNDESHCPLYSKKDDAEFAFLSGRAQWCKRTGTTFDTIHDLWSDGGRQFAATKHLSNKQHLYETPFISFHDDANRALNWAGVWRHQYITVVSVRKLIELGIPVIRAKNVMREQNIFTDRPETFDSEWWVLWHVPREAVVKSFHYDRRGMRAFHDVGGYFRRRVKELVAKFDTTHLHLTRLPSNPHRKFKRKRRAEESLEGYSDHKRMKIDNHYDFERSIREQGYKYASAQARLARQYQYIYPHLQRKWPDEAYLKKRDQKAVPARMVDASTQWEEPEQRGLLRITPVRDIRAVQLNVARKAAQELVVLEEFELSDDDGEEEIDNGGPGDKKQKVQLLKITNPNVEKAWKEQGIKVEEMDDDF